MTALAHREVEYDAGVSWQRRSVGRMVELRAEGYGFEMAFSAALAAHPPTAREDGGYTPQLFSPSGVETVVGAFKRYCRAAWSGEHGPPGSGNGPALVHFTPGMLGEPDFSTPARHAPRTPL